MLNYTKKKISKLIKLVAEFEKTKEELESKNIQLNQLVEKDTLTCLPNRFSFGKKLQDLIIESNKNKQRFTLLLINLDNFKKINDTLGHDSGDFVLKETAQRLLRFVGEKDYVARLGSDEFVILLPDITNYKDVESVSIKIIDSCKDILELKGYGIELGVSIGISVFPEGGASYTKLMKHADIALYEAKNNGYNSTFLFTDVLKKAYKRRGIIEESLVFAIERNQLSLVFQPIYEIKTKNVTGMEALIRWNHPDLGFISPAEFIPISEEVGLAIQLGEWVMNQACHQFDRWYRAGYKNLRFALNLSVCQLRLMGILEFIKKLHDGVEFPASQLVFEITETALMEDEKRSLELLENLDDLSFQISLDDFGTGYSSLSRLQKMPINIIKIDRSFIAEMNEKNGGLIVKAIIDLSRNLGLDVVAEGVESGEQEKKLMNFKCYYAQGFLYSKPLNAEDMTKLLKDKAF